MVHSPSAAASISSEVFMQDNPKLTDALLTDCNFNRNEVLSLLDQALNAPDRCQMTRFYIQAVVTGKTTFLITNLIPKRLYKATPLAETWLIGRDRSCAITLSHLSISRCHAVIGYHPLDGFYITDLGSSNGTLVNRRRLISHERRILQDGDWLQLGELKLEFFLTSRKQTHLCAYEATYF